MSPIHSTHWLIMHLVHPHCHTLNLPRCATKLLTICTRCLYHTSHCSRPRRPIISSHEIFSHTLLIGMSDSHYIIDISHDCSELLLVWVSVLLVSCAFASITDIRSCSTSCVTRTNLHRSDAHWANKYYLSSNNSLLNIVHSYRKSIIHHLIWDDRNRSSGTKSVNYRIPVAVPRPLFVTLILYTYRSPSAMIHSPVVTHSASLTPWG